MKAELAKTYDPKNFESRIYKYWMDSGYFTACVDKTKKPYTIVMPPPNITGQLHMGHALDETYQDVLIRMHRMKGFSALWLPGTDHAAIATEARVVKKMAEDGVTKEDIGRSGFLKRVWEWNEIYGGKIIEQLKLLGCSCDWSKLRFTMDDGLSESVLKVFVKLYNEGLIYRGERIINWCCICGTSISDAEVEYSEKDGFFWHIKYPLKDGSGHIQIATTRPETMLGDTAVAVNPNDEKQSSFIGKTLILPLTGREIPVIADDYVDMDFGTGAVKITPAHDPNDFEVGLRHNLPVINVMDDNAVINKNGGEFEGMDRYQARRKIIEKLEESGLLVKTEPHIHNVGECYRCKTVVEPKISTQWFVRMEQLAANSNKAVRGGGVKFVPEKFEKLYFHWMDNVKDWCISRQLWWGHRIPAYYCGDCEKITVSETAVSTCSCGGKTHQDEDTLDTWFSSALWPFSTLGWPEQTEELNYFYPTDILVTGYDIIFFWVARMIFSGLHHTGELPFNTVFVHGLMRDEQGRKMSKSLDNGVDPIDIIEEYGADVLRYMVCAGTSPGNDMRMSYEKCKAGRNFINKLWNASRFIIMNLKETIKKPEIPNNLAREDMWVLSGFNRLVKEYGENMENYDFSLALGKTVNFTWDVFCDWYIEISKIRLQDENTAGTVRDMLCYIMSGVLKLLHPFIPFVTEELWQALFADGSVMVSGFPEYDEERTYAKVSADFDNIVQGIKAIRAARAEINVPLSRKAALIISAENKELFQSFSEMFVRLAGASEVRFEQKPDIDGVISVDTSAARYFIPLGELVDIEKERARLDKEKQDCLSDIKFLKNKLGNQNFISKAPPQLIENEKKKLKTAQKRLENIEKSIRGVLKN
ncbi:MAG: valine--tRNA ligase [Oscillospiraceae bacterium]|nr:valine--tRNA ligase [Oscillospiraceae bacterium]